MRYCSFFNDTATTEIYTLSLHDALPIYGPRPGDICRQDAHGVRRLLPRAVQRAARRARPPAERPCGLARRAHGLTDNRSEEHTSELQSRQYLVCRLLLEKKSNMHLLTSA